MLYNSWDVGTDLAPLTTVGNLVSFNIYPGPLYEGFDAGYDYSAAISTFVRLPGCGYYVW